MPILIKESDFFPENLFELLVADAPWEVAHVKSRQEKAVARLLREGKAPFYLPQIAQTTKRAGRTFVSHLPLFPGYVFLRRVEGLRQTLRRTSAVVNIIEVVDQPTLSAELRQFRQLQASGAVLTPITNFAPGDEVRVKDGVFGGYSGVVMKEHKSLRLIVSVSMLNRSVSVEFPHEVLTHVKRGHADARV